MNIRTLEIGNDVLWVGELEDTGYYLWSPRWHEDGKWVLIMKSGGIPRIHTDRKLEDVLRDRMPSDARYAFLDAIAEYAYALLAGKGSDDSM